MQVQCSIQNRYLTILATICNPATEEAIDPDAASASFFMINTDGNLVAHALGTINLIKMGDIIGLWGLTINTTDIEVRDLIIIVQSTITINEESRTFSMLASKDFGDKLSVAGPRIVVSPGVNTNINR